MIRGHCIQMKQKNKNKKRGVHTILYMMYVYMRLLLHISTVIVMCIYKEHADVRTNVANTNETSNETERKNATENSMYECGLLKRALATRRSSKTIASLQQCVNIRS